MEQLSLPVRPFRTWGCAPFCFLAELKQSLFVSNSIASFFFFFPPLELFLLNLS